MQVGLKIWRFNAKTGERQLQEWQQRWEADRLYEAQP